MTTAVKAFSATVVLGSFFDFYEFVGDGMLIKGRLMEFVNEYLQEKGTKTRRHQGSGNSMQEG